MRILFVSDTYYPHLNGVYYFVCRIAPLLQEKGHQVAVIAPSETIYSSLKKIDGIDVYGIPSLPVIYYPNVRFPIPFSLKTGINNILKSFKPDIIHIQDHFLISKTIVIAGNKSGIPIVGTNHFMTENLTSLIRYEKFRKGLSKMMWSQFSNVFNRLALVTTPSETAARLIRPMLNVEVIPVSSGVNLNSFNPYGDTKEVRKKYSIPDKPVLLYVGRLDPEKKIDEVLYAVAKAVKTIDFKLVIVGKGIKKVALEYLAEKLGIRDSVIFTGFVPDSDLPYFYKLSRCFIIASTAELLSLSTLQAMATGLPVIAVNAGALGELVHNEINGYLYNGGDIAAIVRYIIDIISQDELCKKMGLKSLEFVQKHTIHKAVDAFEDIYLSNCSVTFRPGPL